MAGSYGRALATSTLTRPIRTRLEGRSGRCAVPVSAEIEDVQTCVRRARDRLMKLHLEGYEAFALEQGQERKQWYHVFRLHSFIILALRNSRAVNGDNTTLYVRLEWTPAGLHWQGPCADDHDLKRSGGVFYPFLRMYKDTMQPALALQRLDAGILAPMESDPKQFSVSKFNSSHWANLVERELVAGVSSPRVPSSKKIFGSSRSSVQSQQSEVTQSRSSSQCVAGGQSVVTQSFSAGQSVATASFVVCGQSVLGDLPQLKPFKHVDTCSTGYSDSDDDALEGRLPQRSASDWTQEVRVPELEYLEPIDDVGHSDKFWCRLLKHQMQHGQAVGIGRTFARPPEQSVLGIGNFGCVWRARDRRTGAWFAVKNMDQRQAGNECEILGHLKSCGHPCIVQMLHFQEFAEVRLCAIVMELCKGGDLLSAICNAREECKLSGKTYEAPSQARVWVGQIFLGLEHLHLQSGILVRDIKPGNVLLDENGQAKISDFGLSCKRADLNERTEQDSPVGTPGYAAPEVLKLEAYDCEADLFSFGALLWVLASGGLSSEEAPQPPSSTHLLRNASDFSPLCDDWQMLRAAAADINGTIAPPICGDVQDLVLRLTVVDSCERFDHAQIRTHSYFEPLRLPPCGAGPALRWLEQCRS